MLSGASLVSSGVARSGTVHHVLNFGVHLRGLGEPAQRGIGNQQDIRAAGQFKLHIGRQIGQQPAV